MACFRKMLLIGGFAFVLATQAHARTFYVDDKSGKDTNPGTSPGVAWKSLRKVESEPLKPGDAILLRAGGTWREQLRIHQSGSGNAPIRFGRYGDGPAPVISGADRVPDSAWKAGQNGIWSASLALPQTPNQLHVDAAWLEPARLPDAGFMLTTSKSPNHYTVIDTHLREAIGSNPVEGAELVLKVTDYAARVAKVTKWNGTDTLRVAPNFAPAPTYSLVQYAQSPGFGFFLRGKLWMLRRPGQWVFEDGTLSVRLDNDARPTGAAIEATSRDYGIVLDQASDVTIEGIAVRYARQANILGKGARNVTIRDVTLSGAVSGVDCDCENASLSGLNIDGALAYGIDMRGNRNRVTRSKVTRTGMNPTSPDSFMPAGIWLRGSDITADRNIVDSSAYIGLRAEGIERDASSGKNVQVVGNTIRSSCLRFNDCAAIYSWLPLFAARDASGLIADNIVQDSIGNPEGTNRKSAGQGIYLDHGQHSYVVRNNQVSNAANGIFINGGYGNTVTGNRVLGSREAAIWVFEYPEMPEGYTRDNVIRGNVLESLSRDIPPAYWLSTVGIAGKTGTSDRNVYCHPNFPAPVLVATRRGGAQKVSLDDRRNGGDDRNSSSISARCPNSRPPSP